jgi:hypothetical protein
MNKGSILFIVIVAVYVGFEAFTISKVAHRAEPLYIFERFAAFDRAMSRCGETDADTQQRFTRNRAAVRVRAELELAEQRPENSLEQIHARLDEAAAAQVSEVDALIDELGCDDTELRMLVRGYENRARLNLNAPEQDPKGTPDG